MARMMSELYPVPFGPKLFSGMIIALGATRCTTPATIVPCPKSLYCGSPSTTAAVDWLINAAVLPFTQNDCAGLAVGASKVSGLLGQTTSATVARTVHLTAPIHPFTIVIAFAGALLGGLLAGAAGGWRAARLSPASALRDLG